MKATATLTLKKSTKGTHVYENSGVGLSLYFPKTMFGDAAENPPAELKLTIEGK